MICPRCGKENVDNARFCSGCGAKLAGGGSGAGGQGPAGGGSSAGGNVSAGSGNGAGGRVPSTPAAPGGPGNRTAIIVAAVVACVAALVLITLLVVFVAVPAFKKDAGGDKKAELETEVTAVADSGKEETQEQDEGGEPGAVEWALPAGSALDDGNLFGNTHCYARMVSDGRTLYFRNPLDNEKTYRIEAGSSQAGPFGEFYMKDMQLADGYIYYCRTSKGDVSGAEPDRNIYRVKLDGTGSEKLTQITYGEKEAWLSFDTVVDGVCYYTYSDGIKEGYHIGAAEADGTGSRELYFIEPSNCKGLPTLNVVDGKIYYKAKDGLNCLDITSNTNQLAVPGFDCEEYIIYGGNIYFSVNANQGEGVAKVRKMSLDGSNSETLFVPPENWVQYIQVNIYRDKLYFIGLLEDPHVESRGTIYSCNLDGTEARPLVERATWFNIVNGRLYYRYADDSNLEASRKEPFYSADIGELEKASDAAAVQGQRLFDTDGYNTGWVQVGEVWYYYDQNHQMAKGQWVTIDGKDYCFDADGRLYVNTTTPDGYQVDQSGAYVAFTADYVDIVNANQSRKLYLASGGKEDGSRMIEHESYYEVTHCGILADTQYDKSVMAGKGVGDTLKLKDTVYRITDIKPWDSGEGEYVGLEYVSGADKDEYFTLGRNYNRDYYILSGDSDISQKDTLYTGSVYFSKDCRVEVLNSWAGYETHTVNAKDYLTKDNQEVGAQHGLSSYFGLSLWGDFDIDTSGLVISYEEYFVS